MAEHNHNGGPPSVPLTAKAKVEVMMSILARTDLTAAQKCIGAGIVGSADREWNTELKTAELQRFANAKDRETVFRATKALDEKRIIAKANVKGQSGRYNILPPSVVTAVIEAYEEMTSGRVKADQSNKKQSAETGRHNQSAPPDDAVGFDPTSQVEPVGFDPTTRAPTHARIETPSGLHISKKDKGNIPLYPPSEETSVSFEKGRLELFNGLKQYWLERFLGDENRLDLALKQAAGYVQPNSMKPLEAQVSSQLAQIVARRQDQDERYLKAVKVKTQQADQPTETKAERWKRIASEIESQGAKR